MQMLGFIGSYSRQYYGKYVAWLDADATAAGRQTVSLCLKDSCAAIEAALQLCHSCGRPLVHRAFYQQLYRK